MKRTPRLLLVAISIFLTTACLGTPGSAGPPVKTPTPDSTATPSVPPTSTAVPDYIMGLKIVYILDGNVWLWSVFASPRQLTSDGDATQVKISDDGTVIAYQHEHSLGAVVVDSSYSYQIIEFPSRPWTEIPDQFDFHPDTHSVYLITKFEDSDTHYLRFTGGRDVLGFWNGDGVFNLSPDGNLLALALQDRILIYRAGASDFSSSIPYPNNSAQADYVPQVVWLSDGTGFYTVLPNPTTHTSKYFFIPADGKFSAQLAEFESVPLDESAPVISPDGLKVAYVKRTGNTSELHVIEASTADTLIASYENAPMLVPWNWSPDSKWIIFSNSHPIFLLKAGIGIEPSPLTASATPNSLRWINADHFIFFHEGNLLIGQVDNPNTFLVASGFSRDEQDMSYYDFTTNALP